MFVSFEGNEGTGKSTQIGAVTEALELAGHSVVSVREPGSTKVGEQIRKIFKNPPEGIVLTPWCETFLLSAARNQLVEDIIRPALNNGSVVIADRFIDSTMVYQGFAGALPMNEVEQVCHLATGGLNPDLTFLFTAPREVIEQRLRERSMDAENHEPADRFDEADIKFSEMLDRGFKELGEKNPGRIVTIDATLPRGEITKNILHSIREKSGLSIG